MRWGSTRGAVEMLGATLIVGLIAAAVGAYALFGGSAVRSLSEQINDVEGYYAGELAVTHLMLRELANQAPLGPVGGDGSHAVPTLPGGMFVDATLRGAGSGNLPALPLVPPVGAPADIRNGPTQTEAAAFEHGSLVRRLNPAAFRVFPRGSLADANTRCGRISFGGRSGTQSVCLRQVISRKWVSTSLAHSCGVMNGSAQCWGMNGQGALGGLLPLGNIFNAPQLAGLNAGVEAVASGLSHSCAIVSGALRCWGGSTFGQVGSGVINLLGFSSPQNVVNMDSGVTSVAAGMFHTCAVKDGGAFCWGWNLQGQLGLPAGVPQTAFPLPVTGLGTGVTDIFAGDFHTCAIKDGSAWCWGSNLVGQIADGVGVLQRNLPLPVPGLEVGVVTMGLGMGHTCASTGDGTRCWGLGVLGALGTGGIGLPWTPVTPIAGAPKVYSSLTGGTMHTCGAFGGQVDCWGTNGVMVFGALLPPLALAPFNAVALSPAGDVETVSSQGVFQTCVHNGTQVSCAGLNATGQVGHGALFLPLPLGALTPAPIP